MVAHDSSAWKGERSQIGKSLRSLLEKLDLIQSGEKTFETSRDDTFPIAFYAGKGFFNEEEAITLIAKHLNIPVAYISEERAERVLELLEQPPLNTIANEEWRENRVLPLEMNETEVVLAVADPLDLDTQRYLQFVVGKTVVISLAQEGEILRALNADLNREDESEVELIVKGEQLSPDELTLPAPSQSTFESSTVDDGDSNAAPVVRLVNKILSRVIYAEASDLHLTPQQSGLSVKARVDGIMQKVTDVPEHLKNPVISRLKLLCGMDIAEKRKPQDGRLRMTTKHGVKDLRISAVPSVYGENIVARILSPEIQLSDFTELGMTEELKERLVTGLKNPSKVNLVTGPTGSGKSSTLYTSLLHLHNGEKNIITIEDPIEYRIEGVTQIQVNSKVGFGFADGLRSILRQDPDVILVGEIRDEETASIAMKTAQTGHQVLSTLHTNSAAAAITRLRDLGVPPYLIASSVGSVIAQRLVRRLCTDCAAPATEEERAEYGLPETARVPVGCKSCRQTGFKGRIGVFSLLEVSDRVQEAIREGASDDELEKIAREEGFLPLREVAQELVENGMTSHLEVERMIGASQLANDQTELQTKSEEKNGVWSQKKILLVEDNTDTRAIFSTILEQEMYDVIEANDGRDAMQKLIENPVDLVVCDIMMPKLDGHGFVQRLRSNRDTRDLPVLMLTASASEETELKSMENGADDFVVKTAKVEILLARIRRLLERTQLPAPTQQSLPL